MHGQYYFTMLKNLKIGKRLSFAFILIIAVFIVSSAISVISIFSVSNSLSNFYNGPFQVVKTSYDMRRMIQSAERSLLWSCTTTNSQETEDRLNQMATDLGGIKDGVTLLKDQFLGDMNLVQRFEAIMDESIPIKEDVIRLSRENKVDESIAIYNSQCAPKLMEAKALLNEIAKSSENKSREFNQNRINARNLAVMFTLVFAAIILLLIVVLCITLTKSLTGPIKEIEAVAKKMEQGQLNVSIGYHSKDELGRLSESMRGMSKRIAY